MRLTAERTKKIEIPGDQDNGYVNIVALDLDMISRIEDKSSDIIYGEDDSNMKFRPGQREDGIAKACMRGWGNLYGLDGSPLKFKKANFKEAAKFAIDVDGERVRFFKFVADEHDKFLLEIESEEKDAIKN